MKRLFGYMKKYWAIYLLGVICLSASIALDLLNPIVAQKMIDDVIVAGDVSVFKGSIWMLVGITIGRAILGYIKEMSFDYSAIHIIAKLRLNLFDHIQALSAHFFEQKNTGELMARIKEDADKVFYALGFGIMLVIEITINVICATILMIQISPKLSLFALITLPIIGFVAVTLEKKIGKTFEKISEQNAKLNTTAQENIAGVRLVKAFAREKYEISKFLKHNQEYADLNIAQAKIWSNFYPKLELLTNVLPVLIITFGGAFVIGEELSIGTLVKFMGYMYMIIWPMRMIGWISNLIAEANASNKKLNQLFNQTTTILEDEHAVEIENFKGKVQFKNVGFKVGDTQVLTNIDFTIKPGKTLAIMGETGSGKSSIMNLLMRFYDKTEGEILLDEIPVEKLTLNSLRKNISVIMQDTFLFSDTIEENIKFGSKDQISTARMLECAKNAEVEDFVVKMESDYQTIIGKKGIGLSGGQKQRISIARALAKHANLIVFDDSTSALDIETEQRIQKKIDELTTVTKMIIAHRISAVKKADEIIILEKGAIVERGTHQELLAQKGRYYETCKEQYEGAHETHQVYNQYEDYEEELA